MRGLAAIAWTVARASAVAAACASTIARAEPAEEWERLGAGLLDGPSTCWDLSGRVEVSVTRAGSFALPAERVGGTFTGRIDGGRWTSFRVEPGGSINAVIRPVTGRPTPSPAPPSAEDTRLADAVLRLHAVLDRVLELRQGAPARNEPPPEGGARLLQEVALPTGDGDRTVPVSLRTDFPEGDALAVITVSLPERLKLGTRMDRTVLVDAAVSVQGRRVGDSLLPTTDTLAVGIEAGSGSQRITRTLSFEVASPCPEISEGVSEGAE